MHRKIDSLLSGKLTPAEEINICREFVDYIMQPLLNLEAEKVNWVNTVAKVVVYVSKHRTSFPNSKKGSSSLEVSPLLESLYASLIAESGDKTTVNATLDALTLAKNEQSSEPNARNYCLTTISMNWFRSNKVILERGDVSLKASAFLREGLCDVWSEIRFSFVKFIEQLVQSCAPSFTQTLLDEILTVCTTHNAPWQSLEGCLAAICRIVEGFGFGTARSQSNDPIDSMLQSRLIPAVWPYIVHDQASVRESAVRAVTVHLVKAPIEDVCYRLNIILVELRNKKEIPEEIEGYFFACNEILKLLNGDDIDAQQHDWNSIISPYLAHPAATVRQVAGTLLKTLVGKHASSSRFLHAILTSLIVPLKNADTYTWEDIEGRFMALDSILRVLVANHWLYNFTSSAQTESRFTKSEPISDEPVRSTNVGDLLETNADIAAEIIQLSKTRNKFARNRCRDSLIESRKASVSFEYMDNVRPVSLLDLCAQDKGTENSFDSLFKIAMAAAVKYLDSDQWELRRVALQVLPYIGESMRWYDMNLFWSYIEELFRCDDNSKNGRSPSEMAASLLLAAWLQQADRICIQIEDDRLSASARLKDYIFATKGICRFVEKLMSFCRSESFDRQTVTSARVLLQFFARTNLSELTLSGILAIPNISLLLHDLMRIGVSLIWYTVDHQVLVADAVSAAKDYGVLRNCTIDSSSRPCLMFGSAQMSTPTNVFSPQNVKGSQARVLVVEQILPEVVALLRHFTLGENNSEQADSMKILTPNNPKENIYLVAGTLLPPLAYLVAAYSFDSDILPFLTDSISVISAALFACKSQPVMEPAQHAVVLFLDQLCLNITRALASSESNGRSHMLNSDNQSFSPYTAARLAFWACRLILKHGDDPFLNESVHLTEKLSKIVTVVSRRILCLVPRDPNSGVQASNEESSLAPNSAWNVVGTGEILRLTPTPRPNQEYIDSSSYDISMEASRLPLPKAAANDIEDSDSFDDFEISDTEDAADDDDDVMVDEDLDELLVEVVTDMRSMISTDIRESAISTFSDEKEIDLLNYLLM